jgi:hypothetical protein
MRIKKDETKKDCQLTSVDQRKKAPSGSCHEVRNCHIAGEDEGDGRVSNPMTMRTPPISSSSP